MTVAVTALFGWTTSTWSWHVLRFVAGVTSAWTLIGISAWGLGWLTNIGRPSLAGFIFAGVGLGITVAGTFCWLLAKPGVSSLSMWTALGLIATVITFVPLWTLVKLGAAPNAKDSQPNDQVATSKQQTKGLVICYTLFGFGYILPATYLPELARQLIDDPQIFGLAWPLFGLAATLSTIVASTRLGKRNRLNVWAAAHILMAIGVLLPCVWQTLTSVCIAALFVGGTFMVITMLSMQEAKSRAGANATTLLGKMSAGFGLGQLAGPMVSAIIVQFTPDFTTALDIALTLAALGLLSSAVYLRQSAKSSTSTAMV